jgi:uncharacterized protein YqjF (DUF2071 family)
VITPSDLRPLPPRDAPWLLRMTWEHLLFAHWPLEPELVARTLPSGLELDTFDGRAWLGVVPFWMSGVRARLLPPAPTAREFPELNVRTYVRGGGRSGVWFYSLDAASALAVAGARATFGLPYFHARMSCEPRNGRVRYASERRRPRGADARFAASYGPTSGVRTASEGSLEHWLTARFALFAVHRGQLVRGEIDHPPWPLQDASAEIEVETMARAAGFELPPIPPLLHFARCVDVRAWPPVACARL